MSRIKYDFQITGVEDRARVTNTLVRLRKSKKIEKIADDSKVYDYGMRYYFLLYEPGAAFILDDDYQTGKYLERNPPLVVLCEQSKHSQIKATLEEIIWAVLIEITNRDISVRTGLSQKLSIEKFE